MRTKCALFIAAAFLAACSKSDGPQEPKNSVNSKITGNGARALNGQTAVFEASRGLSGNNFAANALAFGALSAQSADGVEGKAGVQRKTERLLSVARSGQCTTQVTGGTSSDRSGDRSRRRSGSASDQFQPVSVRIAGGSCPVDIQYSVKMTGINGANPCTETSGAMNCNFVAEIAMTFTVSNRSFAEELGVQSGSMKLNFEVAQSLPNAQNPGPSEISMAMKGKGAIQSTVLAIDEKTHTIKGSQVADILIKMPTQQGGNVQMNGAISEEIVYSQPESGLSQSLSASVTMNGESASENYVVDGERVTAQAYTLEREKFSNSMMGFGTGTDSGNTGGGGSSGGGPTYPSPSPYPYPTPEPQPSPGPYPPIPTPAPDRTWACTTTTLDTNYIHIGYGSQEFIAKSQARQSCQSRSSSCSVSYKCGKQEANANAWYCEASHMGSGRVFGGAGASAIEAGFHARRTCEISMSSACSTVYDSKCVRQ